MEYTPKILKDEIKIEKIVTVHYFEYTKNYSFVGESHDFWEFVYVDNGEISVYADKMEIPLKQGYVIFHKPNEWHNIKADGVVAANVSIISFVCNSKCMEELHNCIYRINYKQKELLSNIIKESKDVFDTPLNDPFTKEMIKQKQPTFGSEQLIKLYLTEFLISVLRTHCKNEPPVSLSLIKNKTDNEITNNIINYLYQNIENKITFNDIVNYIHLSQTSIKNAFSQSTGMGVMKYFNMMKIERAKQYIREENYNISQISNILGYESIHYFSRQFKKHVNLSPMQYAKSIKSITMPDL